MSDDDDFLKDMQENERIKPIDMDEKPLFVSQRAREAEQGQDKAQEGIVDPIIEQERREREKEAARRQKLRSKDENIPDHMMNHMIDDVMEDSNIIGKGVSVDLLKKVPFLRTLYVGAGWEQKAMESEPVDIDLSLFLLNKNDQTREDGDFVFYNQPTACEGAVKYGGDSRTGAGQGDDEGINIDLNGIPYDVVKVMVVLSIYDENTRGDNFGMVRSMYVRIMNKEDNLEIGRFLLDTEDFKNETAIFAATIVREGPRWFFNTLGEAGGKGGLANVAQRYGIIVKELQSTG